MKICGYIEDVNFYQLETKTELLFDDIISLCDDLIASGYFLTAIPDYFEETEVSNTAEESSAVSEMLSKPIANYDSLEVSYDFIKLNEALAVFGNTPPVNAGMVDYILDSDSQHINIANRDECAFFKNSTNNSPYDFYSVSHGMHVAGIIGAINSNTSVVAGVPIYSYNGVNVSTSYWAANLCDMIINNDVKAVNLSMGYNSYISVSAALGCENAVSFIESEQLFFGKLISGLVNNGKEFVICVAAGNENESSLYKIFGGFFSFGKKAILSKLDIFGIFDSKPDYVDAEYCFMLSNCTDKKAAERIITVGGIDNYGEYADFSNVGKVDITAPSVNILSTLYNNKFDYMSGTSMATPYVTGTAIMLFSLYPHLSGEEVKNIIIHSATETATENGRDYPILNIYNALIQAQQ